MYEQFHNIMRDIAVVLFSVIIAIILVKTGALLGLLQSIGGAGYLVSFLGGIFFVSVFTVAPALVVLVETAQTGSPLAVAFFGGLGALLGDLLIFRFVRDSLSRSLLDIILKRENRITAFFRIKFFRIFGPLIGAFFIISPFPDEIGLMLMGVSDIDMRIFIPLTFFLNFIGILILGLFANL